MNASLVDFISSPGKSVSTNMLQCLNDWTSSHDRVDVVYLDFSKAYDRVPHRRLLHKLKHLGSRGDLLLWTKAFISDCSLNFTRRSTLRSVEGGVLPSFVLGPILFSLYSQYTGVDMLIIF